MGKPAFNDIKEGIITAPLIYGLIDLYKAGDTSRFKQLNSIILSKFENKERDVPIGVEMLFGSNGIEMADKLSIDYINLSLENLRSMRYDSQSASSQVLDVDNNDHA